MSCILVCGTGYGVDLVATNKPAGVSHAATNSADRALDDVPNLDLEIMMVKAACDPASLLSPKTVLPTPVSTNAPAPERTHPPVTNEVVSVPILPVAVNALPPARVDPVPSAVLPTPEMLPAVEVSKTAVAPVKAAAAVTNTELQSEPDAIAERLQSVACELAAAKAKIMELAPAGRAGKLKELERKGLEYDSLSTKLELKDQMIARLLQELKAAQKVITNQVCSISELVATTNELTQAINKMGDEKAPLKEALDVLRLGKYEYYQVEKDDTCESIAAKPSIYNDMSKNALIRQANKGSIANLDKLVPGEILVIPRVKVADRHDF